MVPSDVPYWFGGVVTCPKVNQGKCVVKCSAGGETVDVKDVLSYFPQGFEEKKETAVFYLDQESLTAIEEDNKQQYHFICEKRTHCEYFVEETDEDDFKEICIK